MATIHFIVGLPCSGKTTFAKKLEKSEKALLLSPDDWQIRIFDNNLYGFSEAENIQHSLYHDRIEAIMWDVAVRMIALGVDVILDFGFWSKVERDMFRAKAKKIGASAAFHYMDVSIETLLHRLEKRNAAGANETIIFPKEHLEEWYESFEPPTKQELREDTKAYKPKEEQ
ncbi:MAG: AAA family ATPase [Christensenellaceae bacterium]